MATNTREQHREVLRRAAQAEFKRDRQRPYETWPPEGLPAPLSAAHTQEQRDAADAESRAWRRANGMDIPPILQEKPR